MPCTLLHTAKEEDSGRDEAMESSKVGMETAEADSECWCKMSSEIISLIISTNNELQIQIKPFKGHFLTHYR